jgi:aminoglycoside phosphotransferase (APT) family kinase protein
MSAFIANELSDVGATPSPSDAPKKYLGEVGDVRDNSRFDEVRLDAWLRATLPGYCGPLSVKQFDGGQSNPTYLLQTPAHKYVLRRKPPGVLLKSAHAVDREFRVLSALGAHGFPVPEALVLCEDESVIGTMFYVMNHVEGRIFWDCAMPDLTRHERAAIFDSVNETLAKLHRFDPASVGLQDFGRPGNYFGRQIKRWSQQYEATKTVDIA